MVGMRLQSLKKLKRQVQKTIEQMKAKRVRVRRLCCCCPLLWLNTHLRIPVHRTPGKGRQGKGSQRGAAATST